MNKDAEAINQFLAWLSQKPDPATAPSGRSSPASEPEESGEDRQPYIDPLDSEVEAMQADLSKLSTVFLENFSSLELGELPAVQDRFHTIIKRRLRAEIERKPPLFPWETSLWDYESEQPDWLPSEGLLTSLWTAQLQAVKLPVSLPEALLLQIFAECRKVIHTSLKEGVKLVRAVESFFPDETQALNHWAGQVLAEPARSSQTLSAGSLPQTYEAANPTQQMVLSLLAARQVLNAMTLEVSADRSQVQRQWMTTAGELLLEVQYQPETQRLRVEGRLPTEGRLTLSGETNQTTATCSRAETLSVELGSAIPSQLYTLAVELDGNTNSSLTFAVHLVTEAV